MQHTSKLPYSYITFIDQPTHKDEVRWRRTIERCTEKLTDNPNAWQAYCDRGYAQYNLGIYLGTIADYTKAINIIFNLMNELMVNPALMEQNKRILDAYDAMMLEIHIARGLTYFKTLRFSQALADFDGVIKQNPDFAYFYYLRTTALFFLENAKDAHHNLLLSWYLSTTVKVLNPSCFLKENQGHRYTMNLAYGNHNKISNDAFLDIAKKLPYPYQCTFLENIVDSKTPEAKYIRSNIMDFDIFIWIKMRDKMRTAQQHMKLAIFMAIPSLCNNGFNNDLMLFITYYFLKINGINQINNLSLMSNNKLSLFQKKYHPEDYALAKEQLKQQQNMQQQELQPQAQPQVQHPVNHHQHRGLKSKCANAVKSLLPGARR